jgi:hypothetical protein
MGDERGRFIRFSLAHCTYIVLQVRRRRQELYTRGGGTLLGCWPCGKNIFENNGPSRLSTQEIRTFEMSLPSGKEVEGWDGFKDMNVM